jgi:glutaredoxin
MRWFSLGLFVTVVAWRALYAYWPSDDAPAASESPAPLAALASASDTGDSDPSSRVPGRGLAGLLDVMMSAQKLAENANARAEQQQRMMEAAMAEAYLGEALPYERDWKPAPAEVAETAPSVDIPPTVYFQYIDDAGSLRFADSLDQVPERWRARAGRVEIAGAPPTSPAQAQAAREARTRHVQYRPSRTRYSPARAASQDAAAGSEVVVYLKRRCSACRQATAFLRSSSVAYVTKDIESDPAAYAEYLARSRERRGLPLIEIGGELSRGFEPERLKQLLAASR